MWYPKSVSRERFAVLVLACAACGQSAGPKAPSPTAPVSAAASSAPVAPGPRLTVAVDTDPRVQNRVQVTLRFDGPLAAGAPYPFRPLHDVKQSDVVTERLGPDSVRVRYHLDFASALDAAEAIEMKAQGEDLFALPDDDTKLPVDLKVTTGGVVTNAASTFGIGTDTHFEARPRELRNGYYIAGDIGTAKFHATDGNDFAAWIDHTAFDPRFVSAVTASTRGAVDAWVGREIGTETPPFGLLFVATKRDGLPVTVMPRPRGLFISVDRRATWTASARILVAQALVQRYVGGFLWVGSRDHEQDGWFFSDGYSRTIAREILFDNGALEPSERAAEVNEILALSTFATEPHGVALARGALEAIAVDVAARKHGSSLQALIRELLEDAAQRKVDTVSRADFDARMAASLPAEVPLPANLLGPCWRLAKKQLVPFELGFTTSAGQELVVQTVKPKSRAEAAGVKVGDVVSELDYRDGNALVPVKMTVKRGDGSSAKRIPITFSPSGAAKPGRIYERVSGIPDDHC